ncbi:SIS domain-containing protein [Anaerofustis stercorihominis]|uniref:6-phospho 3-hexuloisomerase n=1 Tax=Anaerofustis stercorihominis DSM 17244 TaxID=445971 RepID=B1C6L6_9FIRM|nr:6-phospho-3-hexuloisomerase [Anaerofustis stercorihominis]EDS72653.1 putative 6-phospho 3-hexuloisomerase [Anaerofustis stercorihominis DSM 17244]MCQ4795585.1 SIS domain-containing protein [Anaerofustis stercorihominis]
MDNIYQKNAELILNELNEALLKVDQNEVYSLIEELNKAEKIFFIGVGRVMTMLQCIAKRLKHIGYDTYIVGETTEPPITDKDLLIVGSGSGSTLIPSGIAKKAKSFGARIAHIGAIPDNPLKDITDVFVRIPVKSKQNLPDQVDSNQPMTSLFEQSLLLLGDTITLTILDMKDEPVNESMWSNHANLE